MQGHAVCLCAIDVEFLWQLSFISNSNAIVKTNSTFTSAQTLHPELSSALGLSQKRMFSNSSSCGQGCKTSLLSHILVWSLLLLGKTHDQSNCILTSWMSWKSFFFNVSDVEHSSALRYLPSPPLQFSPPSRLSSHYTLTHSVWQQPLQITAILKTPRSPSPYRPSSASACPIHILHALPQLLLPGSLGFYLFLFSFKKNYCLHCLHALCIRCFFYGSKSQVGQWSRLHGFLKPVIERCSDSCT